MKNKEFKPQPLFHMADLPEDVRTLFTFEDDEIYSIFVTNMRDDTWLIVKDNKGKYLDRLRFVCRKFGIVRKDINTNEGLLPESFNTYNIIEEEHIQDIYLLLKTVG